MNVEEKREISARVGNVADIVFRMFRVVEHEKHSDVALAALSMLTFVLGEMDPAERHLRYGLIRKMLDDFYNNLEDIPGEH